jgi:hypothetical protein
MGMLDGGPGLAKRIAVRRAPSADDPKSVYGDEAVETLEIPLNIIPLLTPYRDSGPLALRIERLHHLGRLSKGRNNGDGSWSLNAEDIDRVSYLLPAIVTQAHTLSVRVVGLGGGTGETIALLDLVVSPSTSHVAAPDVVDAARAAAQRSGPRDETQTRRLQEKLARVQAELAERELEIEHLYDSASRTSAKIDERRIEAELAAARAVWKRELDERLSSAAAELRRTRQTWEAEQEKRRVAAEIEAEERVEEARQRWQREAEAAMLRAEENWRAETAAKLEAAREQWKSLEANLRHEADEELRRLRDERTNLRANLCSRETALEQSRVLLDQAKEEWRRESEAALAKARADWQAEADAQFRTAEARWRAQSEKAVAEVNARRAEAERAREELRKKADAAAVEGHESGARELRTVHEENAKLRSELDTRQSELAQAQSEIETAREEWRRASEAALAKARTEWQTETNAQLAAVEARWKDQAELRDDTQSRILLREARVEWQRESETALAKARAEWQVEADSQLKSVDDRWRLQTEKAIAEADARRIEAERKLQEFRRTADESVAQGLQSSARELQSARDEIAELRSRLDLRDSELGEARAAMERAREEWRMTTDAALTKARAEWQSESNAQLAAVEARWRDQSGQVLTAAEKRAREAEDALAQLKQESETALSSAREERERVLRQAEEERAKLQAELKVQKADAAVAQDTLKRESEAALHRAKAEWHADMRAQFALAEEKWKERSAEKLAEATKRYQSAESALAKLEAEANSLDIALMRSDVVPLKSTTAPVGEARRSGSDMLASDNAPAAVDMSDMSDMDSAFEDFYEAAGIDNKIVLRGTNQWGKTEAQTASRKPEKSNQGLIRDVALAVALAASVMIAFPFVKDLLPRNVQRNIDRTVGEIETSLGLSAPRPQPVVEAAQPASLPVYVTDAVNFRTAPSTAGAVVATLPAGVEVVPLERSGQWVRVRVENADGKGNAQEGWVFSSYLAQAEIPEQPIQ